MRGKDSRVSRARIILHVAAGIGALVAAFGFAGWIGGGDFRGGSLMAGAGIAASQAGALAGWPLIAMIVAVYVNRLRRAELAAGSTA